MRDHDRTLYRYEVSKEQIAEYFPDEFKNLADGETGRIDITTDTKLGRKTITGLRLAFWRVDGRGTMSALVFGTIAQSPRIPFVKPCLPTSKDYNDEVRRALTAIVELNAPPIGGDHPFRLAAMACLNAVTVRV